MKGADLAEYLFDTIIVRDGILQAFVKPQTLKIQSVQTQNAADDDNRPQPHPVGLHHTPMYIITEKVQIVPIVPSVKTNNYL